VECRAVAVSDASGWRAYRVHDVEFDEFPEVVVYCPGCP